MEFCPHCMKPSDGEICTHCGGQIHWTAPATQLPLGTLLRGESGRVYQIGAAKGQGGFGITYAAMDLMNNTRVAIKEYYPTRCASRDHMNHVVPTTGQQDTYRGGMNSFLEEAKMLSAVGALPSVVSVRDYFEANGTAYLVMEYVDGIPLHEVVAHQGRITEEDMTRILPPLMRDLDTLHRAGVIHRDISPDNLILTPEGTLKLLDFGSARSVQDGKSMTVMLKAGFSPVEQYQSKGQGPFTDVYALAGTIYYCLTGKIPPTAIDRISEDTLESPNLHGAQLTTEQEEALLWGMTVQPKYRPQSMHAFSNALFPKTPAPQPDPEPEIEQVEQTIGYDLTTGQRVTTQTKQEVEQVQLTEAGTVQVITPEEPPKTDKKGKSKGGSKKKLIFALAGAAVALVAVVVGLVFLLGGGKTDDGFKYRIKGGDAYITGYTGTEATVTVPATIEEYDVVGVRSKAFKDNGKIDMVILPASVKTVAKNAFLNCGNLTMITLEGKTDFQAGAISGCNALRCIFAPDEDTYDQVDDSRVLDGMDAVVCYPGMDMGQGKAVSVIMSEGMVYALTDMGTAVAVVMPDDVDESDMPSMLNDHRVFTTDGKRVGVTTGTDADGFQYELTASEAIIVGYTGDKTVLSVPDEIDGKTVTIIAGGAFAGNTSIVSVFLPEELVAIQGNAFKDCTGLTDLYSYGTITAAPTAFAGCDVKCVVGENVASLNWNAGSNCQYYEMFCETGDGKLRYVNVESNGVIYGVCDNDNAVLMYVPAGITELTVPAKSYNHAVTWTYPEALKDASPDLEINMGPNMGFPFELYDSCVWNANGHTNFSYSWLLTCITVKKINEGRTADPIRPDVGTVRAAMTRAYELSYSYKAARPSGKSWGSVLDDNKVDWDYATQFRAGYAQSGSAPTSTNMNKLYTAAKNNFSGKADNGEYYDIVGVAVYYRSSKLYVCILGVVLDT